MALGHVLGHGGVATAQGAAQVRGDGLPLVKDFNGGGGVAQFELLTAERERHAVVVAGEFDVVVDVGAHQLPQRMLVA